MKYVIWQDIETPHTGHPLDRPVLGKGVLSKENYESKKPPCLEGPTQVLKEFEASSGEEANIYCDAYLDALDEKSGIWNCSICAKNNCEICNPPHQENELARTTGYRPYKELAPPERGELAVFLTRFEAKYETSIDPRNYWWKKNHSYDYEAFDTSPVLTSVTLLIILGFSNLAVPSTN
jgi:hypothetical protein